MIKQVFVTSSFYALAHALGMQEAKAKLDAQLHSGDVDPLDLPAVISIKRLSRFANTAVSVDYGATYIGMSRSRSFHWAYESGLPWITVDDDIEVTTDCAAAMLEALDDDVMPRVVLTPYAKRDGSGALAMELPSIRIERISKGFKLLKLPPRWGGGMGFVGMNRRAMEEIVKAAPPELEWLDGEDGVKKRALFYERVEDMLWWGEDTSFFRWRVPATVELEALVTGKILHAGFPLDLATL
jgi:hypothetical protein